MPFNLSIFVLLQQIVVLIIMLIMMKMRGWCDSNVYIGDPHLIVHHFPGN